MATSKLMCIFVVEL